MYLTLLYRSKQVRFVYNLNLRQLVSVCVLLTCGVLLSSRYAMPENEQQARIQYAKQAIQAQQQAVTELKEQTQSQVSAMLAKLSTLQAQLNRLNASSAALLEDSGLDASEFNMLSPDALGGPVIDTALPSLASSDGVLLQIEQMQQTLQRKQQQLTALESVIAGHHIQQQSRLSGRPIEKGWLSSYYGVREDPFSGMPAMHKGIDFAGKSGSAVIATGAGIVTWAGERYGYGNLVEIDHGDGLLTRYGHNKQVAVQIGEVVTKGQKIASMGSTGRSTGAHVHYEVLKNGKQQDPLSYLSKK